MHAPRFAKVASNLRAGVRRKQQARKIRRSATGQLFFHYLRASF